MEPINLTKKQQNSVFSYLQQLEAEQKTISNSVIRSVVTTLINAELIEFSMFVSSNRVTDTALHKLGTHYNWVKDLPRLINSTIVDRRSLTGFMNSITVMYSILETLIPGNYAKPTPLSKETISAFEFSKNVRGTVDLFKAGQIFKYGTIYRVVSDSQERMVLNVYENGEFTKETSVTVEDTMVNVRLNALMQIIPKEGLISSKKWNSFLTDQVAIPTNASAITNSETGNIQFTLQNLSFEVTGIRASTINYTNFIVNSLNNAYYSENGNFTVIVNDPITISSFYIVDQNRTDRRHGLRYIRCIDNIMVFMFSNEVTLSLFDLMERGVTNEQMVRYVPFIYSIGGIQMNQNVNDSQPTTAPTVTRGTRPSFI